MTYEQLNYIQNACREWLREAGSGSRTLIPANGPLSRPVEVELKGILTFDNVRITSAVDAETGICYTKLIEQPDGLSQFFDTPFEKLVVTDSTATDLGQFGAMRPTQKQYHDRMQRVASEQGEATRDAKAVDPSPWWIENSDSEEQPKFLLFTSGKVLGYSLLERTHAGGQRGGRFLASDDYFDYADVFTALPLAENEWMEANAREAYGLMDNNASEFGKRFVELTSRIEELMLSLEDANGNHLETAVIKIEDLSSYYDDDSERWLYVSFSN
jgi:hypothetical protein